MLISLWIRVNPVVFYLQTNAKQCFLEKEEEEDLDFDECIHVYSMEDHKNKEIMCKDNKH